MGHAVAGARARCQCQQKAVRASLEYSAGSENSLARMGAQDLQRSLTNMIHVEDPLTSF